MHDSVTERIVEQIAGGLGADDCAALTGLLSYFGRCSLPVLRVEGVNLLLEQRFVVVGEVDQYRLSVLELIALWQGLKQGRAIEWASLKRA